EDFLPQNNRIVAFYFLTSPYAFTHQTLNDGSEEFFVRAGRSGEAIAEAFLDFYQIDSMGKANRVTTLKTNERGYARLAPEALSKHQYVFCVARKDKNYTYDTQGISL